MNDKSANTVTAAPDMPSSLARVGRLARKELSEILRDRRTIVTLVAMPLLLYPLMSIAFQQFFLASKLNPARGPDYRLGISSEAAAKVFHRRLERGDKELHDRAGPSLAPPLLPQGDKAGNAAPQIKYLFGTPEELEQALHNGQIDLLLRLPGLHSLPAPDRDWDFAAEAIYPANAAGALGALAFIERRLAAANEADLRQRLNRTNVRPHAVVIRLSRTPLAATGSDTLVSLPALVPLILILMTITGAVYPAIDLTAGERERGTLEILVAAPVPRFALLSAKYVAVVTVAVLTALVNVASMALTLAVSGLWPLIFAEGSSPLLLVLLFGLLLLFAAFFSAVLLCLTSFARSFKEAQAYLIPLMLASLAPGVLAMLPGLQLNLLLAGVPLVNVVLLARDLLQGGAAPALAGVVVLTTLLYALAALSLAARVFGSENVLYSDQSGWADLFRRPEEPRQAASVAAALWCLAVLLPLHFALRAALPLLQALGMTALLLAMTAGSVLLFGALPLVFAYLGHVEPRSGFRLQRPRAAAILAGLVLGCSLWPLVLEMLTLVQTALPEVIQEYAAVAAQQMRTAGPLMALSTITAAICEEFFFRGFLFAALRRTSGPGLTIGVTAVLFGLTHTALGGALGLGQLLPSTLLGVVLGVVCWVSGSVWPGLILHVCHNALLVLLSQGGLLAGPDWLIIGPLLVGLVGSGQGWGPLLAAVGLPPPAQGLPAAWLLGGMLGTVVGVGLLFLGRRRIANPQAGRDNEQ